MCSEQRLREERYGMLAKVRGDVTDAQAAVRRCVCCELDWWRREMRRISTIPILILGKNRLGRDVGAISERKQQVPMATGMIGPQCQRLSVAGFGFCMSPLR